MALQLLLLYCTTTITILYYTILYYTTLYYTVLYYTTKLSHYGPAQDVEALRKSRQSAHEGGKEKFLILVSVRS